MTIILSGIKVGKLSVCRVYVFKSLAALQAPSPNRDGRAELYGDEAKFFVETRLLQRDVKVILSGVSNANFVGSVIHPRMFFFCAYFRIITKLLRL